MPLLTRASGSEAKSSWVKNRYQLSSHLPPWLWLLHVLMVVPRMDHHVSAPPVVVYFLRMRTTILLAGTWDYPELVPPSYQHRKLYLAVLLPALLQQCNRHEHVPHQLQALHVEMYQKSCCAVARRLCSRLSWSST